MVGICGLSVIIFFLLQNKEVPDGFESSILDGLPIKAEHIELIGKYTYTEIFSDPEYNFTFRYPSGFEIMKIPDGLNNIVIVQDRRTQIGIQIISSKLGESIPEITEGFLGEELPDLVVQNFHTVQSGGVQGLLFDSTNPHFQNGSSELWFARGKMIYQLSTYRALRPLLESVAQTWKFNE